VLKIIEELPLIDDTFISYDRWNI